MENVKYIVIDVETPNRHNDSICQIGISFLDDNFNEVNHISQLVNPQAEFDRINIKVHHIKPEDVEGKPIFKELWKEYEEYFKNCIVVCHQHSTDLVVIDKQLKKYGIDFMDCNVNYIDTLDICKNECFSSNRLENVCNELSLCTLEAHDAGNDCRMCAELFTYFANNGYDCCVQKYQGYTSDDRPSRNSSNCGCITNENKYSEETRSIRELTEYLKKISSDKRIAEEELYPIFYWLSDNSNLAGTHPYDKIYQAVDGILVDGRIDDVENEELCNQIEEIINPKKSDNFFMPNDTVIDFAGKSFVLSGEFEKVGWTKEVCKQKIENKGGVVKKDVSGKTDYLIVGNSGSDSWKFGNYGGKINKALSFNTPIISEDTFINNVGDEND